MSTATKENDENKDNKNLPSPNATKTEKSKRVRVICDGVLGPLGLVKGNITADSDYVALLKTKRGRTLVEEVK